MTITVTGPDDATFDFPDDTQPDVIQKAMATAYPQQKDQKLTDITPEEKASATAGTALQGVPVLGAYVPHAAAAMSAGAKHISGSVPEGEKYSDTYAKELDRVQKVYKQLQDESPGTTTALQTGGNLLSYLAFGLSGAGARALGFDAAKGLVGNTITAGKTGAIIGAADTAARGGDAGDIAREAAITGTTNAIAPGLGKAVGGVVRALKPQTIEQKAVGKLAEQMKAGGIPGDEGQPYIVKPGTMATEQQAADRGAAQGPEATIADFNPTTQKMLSRETAQPGEAQGVLSEKMNVRSAGAGQRLSQAADNAFGQAPTDEAAFKQALSDKMKADATPLYEKVLPQPIKVTNNIRGLGNSEIGPDAIAIAKGLDKDARAAAIASGQAAPPPFKIRPEDLNFSGFKNTNLHTMDLVKRGFDDIIQSRMAGNRTLGPQQVASAVQIRNALVRELDKQVPQYASARNAWAGPSAVSDAFDAGKNIWKRNFGQNEYQAATKGMTRSEQAAFKAGAHVSAHNTITSAPGGEGRALTSLMGSTQNQQMMQNLVGAKKAADLMRAIKTEQNFALSHAKTSAYKAAEGISAEKPGFVQRTAERFIFSHEGGVARGTALDAIQHVFEKIGSGRKQDIALALAKMKAASGPEYTKVLQKVMEHAYRVDRSGNTNKLISAAIRSMPTVVPRSGPENQ